MRVRMGVSQGIIIIIIIIRTHKSLSDQDKNIFRNQKDVKIKCKITENQAVKCVVLLVCSEVF